MAPGGRPDPGGSGPAASGTVTAVAHGLGVRDPERLIRPGDTVDQFEVVRLLGRGGMGEVYLARDTGLGRKVALKVLRPRSLGSTEMVERFLQEARITARFNHPHIISIYAVGRIRGSPYVALEYLEGQSLRQRLREERLGFQEAVRFGLAIAEALQEAHRHRVLHRDLKPDNVMLPRDGRLRVLDFGLAKSVADQLAPDDAGQTMDAAPDGSAFETRASGIRGTPLYMAPEQWDEEVNTAATDVWALGLMLWEMATGSHPLGHLRDPYAICMRLGADDPIALPAADVPVEFRDLVRGCLRRDPARRPPLTQVIEGLHDVLSGPRSPLSDERSPFRGLLAFAERHADRFFGRDAEIATFLERLRDEPTLGVVGLSGVGKSSFVSAGVVPRLREQGRWIVLSLRPGRFPIRALAGRLLAGGASVGSIAASAMGSSVSALAGGLEGPSSADHQALMEAERQLLDELVASPAALALHLSRLAAQEGRDAEPARVLLLVDQLEEVYTLVDDEERRRVFLDAVFLAADDPLGPVRTVFTVRDDYLGRLASLTTARDALGRLVVLGRPGPAALREIMTRPLTAVGYDYDDPTLVTEMVEAVQGETAALPLLQFTGRLLWERRDRGRRRLRRADHDAIGGVAGALAHHADGVMSALTPSQARAAREILLRLVTHRGTRRVVPRGRLLDGLGEGAAEVLQRLVADRTVVVRKGQGGAGGEPELELAHESMIHTWGQLARWIEESREELAFLAEVGQSADLWERRGRRDEEVWTGDALRDARRSLERATTRVPEGIVAFLAAGERVERRRQRRNRALWIGTVVVLVAVALGALWTAVTLADREAEAQIQRRAAEDRHAEAQREGARAARMRGDLLETRARLRASLETQDSPLARALWWQLRQQTLRWAFDLGSVPYAVAFSPGGTTVAVGAADHVVRLIDTRTGEQRALRGHADQVRGAAYTPATGVLVTASKDGDVWAWDASGGTGTLLAHVGATAGRVAASGGGAWVAVAAADGVHRVAVADGAHERIVELAAPPSALALSGDDRTLAIANGAVVLLVDALDGARLRELTGHENGVTGLAFGPDGRRLYSSSYDGTVAVWDPRTGERLRVMRVHGHGCGGLDLSPDGALLATVGWDHLVRLWEADTGRALGDLGRHDDGIWAVRFAPDGRYLVTAGQDMSVRLWDARPPARTPAPRGHEGPVHGAAFSPDGRTVATAGKDGAVRLWDVASGLQLQRLSVGEEAVNGVAFDPSGSRLATGGDDRLMRVWDLVAAHPLMELSGHFTPLLQVAFNRSGDRMVSCSTDGKVRLWDAAGELRRTIEEPGTFTTAAVFHPDERRLWITTFNGVIVEWDGVHGRRLRTMGGHRGAVWGGRFSADGSTFVSGGDDRTVRLWDVAAGTSEVLATLPGRVYFTDMLPDGRLVGAPTADGTASILTVDGGRRTVLRGHHAEVNTLRFDPSGRLAVTTSDDGTVRLWEVDTGRPAWRGVLMLPDPPRMLTHRGWIDVGDGDGRGTAVAMPPAAWIEAVERRATAAEVAPDGSTVCLRRPDGGVELWDVATDERRGRWDDLEATRLVAVAGACAALDTAGRLWWLGGGRRDELLDGVTAVVRDGASWYAATGDGLLELDDGGGRVRRLEVSPGVTAVARCDADLVLGFADGGIEAVAADPDGAPHTAPFSELPTSAVTALAPGPMNTVIVGDASGGVGIWSRDDGLRLIDLHLHGPVHHLMIDGHTLVIGTELGDHETLDLRTFVQPRCDVLREVWDDVPVVWSNARPVLRPPDPDHPCRE